jgi:ribulose-5-phosphate 4-epimerase/fuculose-1-phosphate aldolase
VLPLTPSDMVEVDLSGRKRRGPRNPTSELDLHLRILQCRPDIRAVVHAHPPVATGFAVAGQGFTTFVLPELILQAARALGRVTELTAEAVARLEGQRSRARREQDG